MNNWPDGALTREEVSELLQEPTRWHVEWCTGGRAAQTESGFGDLPDGVLERVPTRAKRRKFQQGTGDHRTWFFAYLSGDGEQRLLTLHEGP